MAFQVALYLGQLIFGWLGVEPFESAQGVAPLLALSGAGVAAGHSWEFFTYAWLHHGPLPLHLLGTLWLLFYAGREVEPILGAGHVVAIYLLGNLVGGVAHWAVLPGVPLLGAAGGSAAMVAAFSTLLPELEVRAPCALPWGTPHFHARLLGIGVALSGGVLWLCHAALGYGPVALTAGAFVGWFYVERLGFGAPLSLQRYLFQRRRHKERLSRMSLEEFIHSEIDPILEKISRKGLRSLSRAERRVLENGRKRMAQEEEEKAEE